MSVFSCATKWSRVGTSVPSTMSTVSSANRLRGCRASFGPRWSMMRGDQQARSLPNCRGSSPVNGRTHAGSDAVITPATTRSFHCFPPVVPEGDAATFDLVGHLLKEPAHDLVRDDVLIVAVDVDGRFQIRSSSGTSATMKAAPGRYLSALVSSAHVAGAGTASLSSTAQASSGKA